MKLRHIILLAVALLLFLARMRPVRFGGTETKSAAAATTVPEGVRITQFYAASPQVALGEKTLLCYGVENAKAVRLEPAVEKVWPALVRCFDVVPPRTTNYTLIAEDAQGKSVSASTSVEVGPAKPKLVDISINKLQVGPGEQVVLCFKAQNATSYDAGIMKPISVVSPSRGCFADNPRKTTTYSLKVRGPGGEDSERATVTVR